MSFFSPTGARSRARGTSPLTPGQLVDPSPARHSASLILAGLFTNPDSSMDGDHDDDQNVSELDTRGHKCAALCSHRRLFAHSVCVSRRTSPQPVSALLEAPLASRAALGTVTRPKRRRPPPRAPPPPTPRQRPVEAEVVPAQPSSQSLPTAAYTLAPTKQATPTLT